MPGLMSIAGSALVFDKPEGRIVEAQAQGAVRAALRCRRSMPPACRNWAGEQPAPICGSAMPSDCSSISAVRTGSLTVGFMLSPQ